MNKLELGLGLGLGLGIGIGIRIGLVISLGIGLGTGLGRVTRLGEDRRTCPLFEKFVFSSSSACKMSYFQ